MFSAFVSDIMAESTYNSNKNRFTCYLNTEPNTDEELQQERLKPKMLSGELDVTCAKNVFLYTTQSYKRQDRDNGLLGVLFITNFKLSFLPSDKDQNTTYQDNVFLQRYEITMSNIDRVYQIVDRKKRLLDAYSKISSRLEELHIICKNFRVLRLGFQRSEYDKARNIAAALQTFAFPNQHNLLFAYKYNEKYYNSLRNILFYTHKNDWSRELNRCGARYWRVISTGGEEEIPNGSLPLHYVIPSKILDSDYNRLANSFRNGRAAIWVFSLGDVSLLRMAELMPTITDSAQENIMLENVRRCDPMTQPPHLLELSKCLPSNQDVQISYIKFRDLFTPDSTRHFLQQDLRFYSLVDKSCWLFYVSLCLKQATFAAQLMSDKGQTVVLQENDGRDMCCVISSLIQLILDPYFRTMSGIASLIQKEWVALGHAFSDRLGHVINSDTSEQSPLFLLFLDCTWQLLQQFPEEFEFSETFLTTLWDSAFLPIFDTFLFNSEHDRQVAIRKEKLILRPVWDWGEQFSDKDLALFVNPLYKKPPDQPGNSRKTIMGLPSSAIPLPGMHEANSRHSMLLTSQLRKQPPKTETRYLKPSTSVRDMEIWMQCYYRWLPVLEIKNGGNPQIDLFNRITLSSISKLQQELQIRSHDVSTSATSAAAHTDDYIKNMPLISSFFPFTSNLDSAGALNDILTASNELLADGSIFDTLSIQQRE